MKKIIYIFDDINYKSGAQKVMFYQMHLMRESYDVKILSLTKPSSDTMKELLNIEVYGTEVWNMIQIYNIRLGDVLRSADYGIIEKTRRLSYTAHVYMGLADQFVERILGKHIKKLIGPDDIVIVTSEASKTRNCISKCKLYKKIQWVHTDYLKWKDFSSWTKRITRNDEKIYSGYDYIVTLNKRTMEGFTQCYPKLSSKVTVIPNVICEKKIKEMSSHTCSCDIDSNKINIITIGRLDKEKAINRIIDLSEELKRKYEICWYIVGDGPEKETLQKLVQKKQLKETVKLIGRLENPYPLLKKCDIFALLSIYEGTPVTIAEAQILGVPIIATDVGGIKEQLGDKRNAILVKNEYSSILAGLENIIDQKGTIKQTLNNDDYEYPNDLYINQLKKIIDGEI